MENSQNHTIQEEKTDQEREIQVLLKILPKERDADGTYLYFYQGFWCPFRALDSIISFQKHFKAQDTDIILNSFPKTGTTWLKALVYTIVTRSTYPLDESPLLSFNPHHLVPFFEFDIYHQNPTPDLENITKPRFFSTHAPFSSLAKSIIDSKCKMVYISRNPMDQLISYWHFGAKLWSKTQYSISLDDNYDLFCRGVASYGPYWDHVLGYWNASQNMPNKILFLKYEDLKIDIVSNIKLIAEFLECPFTVEEERDGLIGEISRLCSFENLKNIEVNKIGKRPLGRDNSDFFRKATVGDWSNYLTPSRAENLQKIVEEKFAGSGLSFKTV